MPINMGESNKDRENAGPWGPGARGDENLTNRALKILSRIFLFRIFLIRVLPGGIGFFDAEITQPFVRLDIINSRILSRILSRLLTGRGPSGLVEHSAEGA